VVQLASKFVPAADEVFRLQSGSDAECKLFQKIGEQGHYGGRPGTTRQGTYAATPSGVLLASINSNDPARIADMLERALAKWEKLGRAERLSSDDPQTKLAAVKRPERLYPQGGLVLHVYSRDLPRESPGKGWRGNAWNQDYAWFTKKEARQIVPAKVEVGQQQQMPMALVHRIACAHLIDNVRGQTTPYDDKHVKKAQLSARVTAVDGDVVTLRLEGETRTAAEGNWPVQGNRDRKPGAQKRVFEARLLGKATYDLKKERFLTFELLAVGMRWGATQFNVRRDDPGPAPMGVLFTIAGDTPNERVAPAFHYHRSYRWEK
jgi:hypothetical protein